MIPLVVIGALGLAAAADNASSRPRAPGRIRRAGLGEVEEVFRWSGLNLANDEEPYEVFVHDGVVLGASSFGWTDQFGIGDRVGSFSVAVLREARGRGIGERLVRSLVRQHPGAVLEPWVVNPIMARLLERLGFEAQSRHGWSPDSPYMTLDVPRAKRPTSSSSSSPPPTTPLPAWANTFSGPVTLDDLDLAPSARAEAERARAAYAASPAARQAQVRALLAQRTPIPGLSVLASPGVGDRWQIVLGIDPAGRDETPTARSRRLLRVGYPPPDILDAYSCGGCIWLALALHDRYGWPLYAQIEDEDGPNPYIAHAYVRRPNSMEVDIFGPQAEVDVFAPTVRTFSRPAFMTLLSQTSSPPRTPAEIEAEYQQRRPEVERVLDTWIAPLLLETP